MDYFKFKELDKNGELLDKGKLNQLQQKYDDILSKQSPELVEKVLKILSDSRENVHSNNSINVRLNIEQIDEQTKKIFELMKEYEQEVKQIFIDKGESITHITDVSPEKMCGGKIKKSRNKANNYETESGDWVFASSSPVDGSNPYIARKSENGMIRINRDMYIYGGNNMQINQDERGRKHVVLKESNYVYEINPQNFTPVVTLKKSKEGNPYFEFSEEWISEEEIDINNPNQLRGIKKIFDITELLENYQVLCDVNMTGEAMKIRSSESMQEALQTLRESIKRGKLRYINGEVEINVDKRIKFEDIESGKYNLGDYQPILGDRRKENVAKTTNETRNAVKDNQQNKDGQAVGEEK